MKTILSPQEIHLLRMTGRMTLANGGGDDPPPAAPAQQTVTQTNIPEYAQPYFERMMARTEGVSNMPYQPYNGPRVAPLNANQQDAGAYIRSMTAPASLGDAYRNTQAAALGAAGTAKFQANPITSSYTAKPLSMFGAPQSAQMYANPGSVQMFQSPDRMQMFDAPNSVNTNFDAGGFNADTAAQYMNPYQQGVTDIAKREATRQAGIQTVARDAASAQRGSFGGSRQALVQAEADRNLNQQLSDIQMQGSNAAYQNAQSQYERDRQAGLSTQQMGLGAQQFNSAQQMAYGNAGLGAQNANINAALQYGNMGLGAQQFNVGANQRMGQDYLSNQQFNSGQQMQYGQLGMQTQQFNEAQRQAQAQMALNASVSNEQAREAAAGIQQAGYGMMNQVAGQQTNLAQTQQQMGLDRFNALMGVGNQQQATQQRALDQAYVDYVNQRNYPQQQLNFYSGILRGVPVSANTDVTSYNAAPSAISQLTGLGIGAMGAYGMASR